MTKFVKSYLYKKIEENNIKITKTKYPIESKNIFSIT